jgi:glycosyltransferase involved in cell wall biosynthesis
MHAWNDDRIFQRACIGIGNKGHDIVLIATEPPSNEEKGVQIIPLKKRTGIKRRIFSSFEAYKKAKKLDSDIYQFHDPDLLPWMWLLSRKGKRVIYDVHENYSERLQNSSLPAFIKVLALKTWIEFERFCVSRFSGVITTTNSMQQLFNGISTPKIAVSNTPYIKVLEGINLDTEKQPFTIYTSGTHSNKRNCMQTVEALPLILKEIPQAQMIFVGRYSPASFEQELNDRAKELGVSDHLETYGMQPWKENFKRTAFMEVGCVFYADNPNNRVTIPNRLFEYMYAHVAVIGESFPEIKRVIEKAACGLTVNSADSSEIANGIIALFKDQKALKRKQKSARAAIESEFAFEIELEKMIDFYLKIATSNS